ncbi:MAG: GIY-YIG nuclease family protein [Patescibacteria group bacterium]
MEKAFLDTLDIPDEAGVYFFKSPAGKILYIGKATSLKQRVRSYFSADLVETRGTRITGMIAEATSLSWECTDSVLEALILEATLIKKHQPIYNAREKDNTSFNHLVITEEKFPRVLLVRGRELELSWQGKDIRYVFGPFPHAGSLKEALKLVRDIFPFRDKCTPESGKPCFNRQIGLCPGVCSGESSARAYAQTIRHIALLFSAKKGELLDLLRSEMQKMTVKEDFEKAQDYKRQIAALTHIRDVALIKREEAHATGFRIEAYDVAHTAGRETVGVMTVLTDGVPDKSSYRMFKIRTVKNNDVGALSEILERRLNHLEWPLPRLVVVDGGKAQLMAAQKIFERVGIRIPIVAVTKDEHHRPRNIIGGPLPPGQEPAVLLGNAEAHRYALNFHDKRRRRVLYS